jgi:ATP dependent DNA ligase C terminal region
MTASLLPLEDDSSTDVDALAADVDNATIELEATWNGPCCEKCQAPMKSDGVAVCRRCGWYARLGQFVDVDHAWETYDDEAAPQAPQTAPSHLQVWLNLLPRWAWILIGTAAAVVAESIAARILTAEGSTLRTTWSLTQLVFGAIAFAGCHLVTFLFAIADDADTGAFDFILRPLKLWIKAFKQLPARLWLANTAIAGLTAATMSIVVIGGLPYERLWDWGFKQPPQPNLMGAVISQVQKVEGTGKDLEGAIGDFAGQAGDADGLGKGDKIPPPPPKPRLSADCVILGFRIGKDEKIESLLLGTAFRHKLVFACTVKPQLSDEEGTGLLRMLQDSHSSRPYVATSAEAEWVVPKYSCRVTYETQSPDSGRLLKPEWKEYIGALH